MINFSCAATKAAGIFVSANGTFAQSTSRRSRWYLRLATRYEQSAGQSIVTSRSVPHQTAQMSSVLAGQYRLGGRFWQMGQGKRVLS